MTFWVSASPSLSYLPEVTAGTIATAPSYWFLSPEMDPASPVLEALRKYNKVEAVLHRVRKQELKVLIQLIRQCQNGSVLGSIWQEVQIAKIQDWQRIMLNTAINRCYKSWE